MASHEHHHASNHQHLDSLLHSLLRVTSKKTWKFCINDMFWGEGIYQWQHGVWIFTLSRNCFEDKWPFYKEFRAETITRCYNWTMIYLKKLEIAGKQFDIKKSLLMLHFMCLAWGICKEKIIINWIANLIKYTWVLFGCLYCTQWLK